MVEKIYQIRISLMGSKPKIWRRILIQSDMLLSDFHKVIQTTMGWLNCHLHKFSKNETFFIKKDFDDDFDFFDYGIDYTGLRISDLLKKEKEKIIYEYDFGDFWTHKIVLQKILLKDDKKQYPICLSGKRNCPPEDAGGIWRYENILEILKQTKHKEYKELIEWIDADFDPEFFNKKEINEMLQLEDFGCIIDIW